MKEPKTNRGFYREPKGSSDSTHYQKILASPPFGLLGLFHYYQNPLNTHMNTKQEILGILLFFVLMIGVSVLIAWHKGHINERIIDTINSVRSDSCVHGTRFIISCRSATLPDA